jgi:hypothetical protein
LNGGIEKEKFKNNKEVLLHGDPGRIGGNAAALDGPNQRLNSTMRRLQVRFKKELDLAERMGSLLEALP